MLKIRSFLMIIAATVLVAGCEFVDENLTPVLTGEEPSGQASSTDSSYPPPQQMPPSSAQANPQPATLQTPPPPVTSGNYNAGSVTSGTSASIYVREKVAGLRADLQRLQSSTNQHNAEFQQTRQQMTQDTSNYSSLVASMNSNRQVGTTPNQSQAVAQWNSAQAALARLNDDITRLIAISNSAASDSALAAYLRESVHAAHALPGAVEEDYRQLATIEADCIRIVAVIDRLLNDIGQDISQQSNYVANERRNLTVRSLAIMNGEISGQSPSMSTNASVPPQQVSSAANAGTERRPLVVIRFDRPNISYEEPLYKAVSSAIERRPDAVFDVVAVAPASGTPDQIALNTATSSRNAAAVMRSLTNMGLPADRINLSATTSSSAQTSQVLIYVR